jgi:beta-mannosidase
MEFSLNGSDWRIMGLMPTEWVWRRVGDADVDIDHFRPAAEPWYPAVVPGDVQSDMIDAGQLPDPWYEENSRACEWTSHRDWVYRYEFSANQSWAGKTIRIRFEGVDSSCHIFLNGSHLGDHEGMYGHFEFQITSLLRFDSPNRLIVVVDHAPMEPQNQGQIGRTSEIRLWKARFSYNWDWCTRLIPLGIWGNVSLLITDDLWINDVWVRPELNDTMDQASIAVKSTFGGCISQSAMLKVDILQDGETVASATTEVHAGDDMALDMEMLIKNPLLWYPNGSGSQPLYMANIVLLDRSGNILDDRSVRFGIRNVRAIPCKDASPDALPYLLEVNGRKTYIKGWNWAPVDQLYGRPHEEQYRRLIQLAAAAHCNLLRVWGGGLLERESFYSLCDEAGIMVWQEFIQSSSGIDNEPASDAEYLDYCRIHAEEMVALRRNHPSLVIWCGGNELTSSDGTPLDETHPNIQTLAEVVSRLDPDRIFLPTSPSGPVFGASPENYEQMHDVHGNWNYMGNPDHYHFYNAIDPLFHSEFGAEGAANLFTIQRILAPEHRWPADSSNPHWNFHANWWTDRESVEKLFGALPDLETYVKASQWVQAEGLRYIVESGRRRKWRTSGTIPWQFNESWPNTVCTNCVDYYGHPKPVYYAVRNAYAPLLISARYDSLVWRSGENWNTDIWLSCSLPEKREVRYQARLIQWSDDMELYSLDGTIQIKQATSIQICKMDVPLPSDYSGILELRLHASDDSGMAAENSYLFSITHPGASDAPFSSLLHVPPTDLQVTHHEDSGEVEIRNMGNSRALFVHLSATEDYAGLLFDDNYFHMETNQSRIVHSQGTGPLLVKCWNSRE